MLWVAKQRLDKKLQRLAPRRAIPVPLQVAHRAGADAGAFRQAYLCQSGRQPIALEERAKWCSGRRWICGHTLSHPFLRRGNGAFVIVAPRMLDGEASVSERHGAAMHGGAE